MGYATVWASIQVISQRRHCNGDSGHHSPCCIQAHGTHNSPLNGESVNAAKHLVITIMQDVLRASASRQCAWFGNGTSVVSGTWRVGYDLTIVAIIDMGGRVIAEWRSRLSNQIHTSYSRQSRLVPEIPGCRDILRDVSSAHGTPLVCDENCSSDVSHHITPGSGAQDGLTLIVNPQIQRHVCRSP